MVFDDDKRCQWRRKSRRVLNIPHNGDGKRDGGVGVDDDARK